MLLFTQHGCLIYAYLPNLIDNPVFPRTDLTKRKYCGFDAGDHLIVGPINIVKNSPAVDQGLHKE